MPEFAAVFAACAQWLLQSAVLYAGGRPHRITELEVYWHGPHHPDNFTHGDPQQREFGRWYFHRQGETYKSGTYKGLDIAVGNAAAAGGLLLRGLAPVTDAGGATGIIDGPSLCVDQILRCTGQPSVAALAASFDGVIDETPDSPLYLASTQGAHAGPVFRSPRVGLTLRRDAAQAVFLGRSYRFLSEPRRIKKGRLHLVLGMHRDGLTPAQICEHTGYAATAVARHIAAFEAGKSHSPAEFRGDLTSDTLCQLLGACAAVDPATTA